MKIRRSIWRRLKALRAWLLLPFVCLLLVMLMLIFGDPEEEYD